MARWELVGNSTGKMFTSMSGDEWKQAIQTAKERLEERSRQVGTDPGAVEKADILNVAVNISLQELFHKGIEELGLTPISEADIDVPVLNSEEMTVSFRFAVMPEFELGDLSSLKYIEGSSNVTSLDVETEIVQLKKNIAAQGQAVPEDDDEFARGFGIESVETIDDLRGSINDALIKTRKAQAEIEAENRLLDDLCKLVDLEAPDGMVDMEIESMIAADKDKTASMNGDWEEFLKAAKKTEDMLREEYRPEAARNIKIRLILDRVAEENGLNPTAEEIEKEYESMAKGYNVPVDDIKSAISEDDIIYQKRIIMAMDHLKK